MALNINNYSIVSFMVWNFHNIFRYPLFLNLAFNTLNNLFYFICHLHVPETFQAINLEVLFCVLKLFFLPPPTLPCYQYPR
jgi:hypothetical protein